MGCLQEVFPALGGKKDGRRFLPLTTLAIGSQSCKDESIGNRPMLKTGRRPARRDRAGGLARGEQPGVDAISERRADGVR